MTVRPEKSWFKRPNYPVPGVLPRLFSLPIFSHTRVSRSPFFIIPHDSVVPRSLFVPFSPGIAHNTRSLILAPDRDFLKASRNVPENRSLAKYRRYPGNMKIYCSFFCCHLGIAVLYDLHNGKLQIAETKGDFEKRVEIFVTIILWKLLNVSNYRIVNLSFSFVFLIFYVIQLNCGFFTE